MKKLIFISLFLSGSFNLLACDVCALYADINPNDYKSSIGFYFRSRFMSGMYGDNHNGIMMTKHGTANEKDKYLGKELKEIYNVYELRGSYFFRNRYQLMFSLPYINNYRSVGGYTDFDIYGFGDPTLIFNGIVYATPSVDESNLRQRLTVGAGVKLPMGALDKDYIGLTADIDLQPGTGSFDYLFLADYSLRNTSGWGTQVNAVYRINTQNKEGAAYGNFFNAVWNVFYQRRIHDKITVMPSLGAYMENSGKDRFLTEVFENTGGSTLMGNAGFDVFIGQLRLFFAYQQGIYHNFKSSLLPVRNRIAAGAVYNF